MPIGVFLINHQKKGDAMLYTKLNTVIIATVLISMLTICVRTEAAEQQKQEECQPIDNVTVLMTGGFPYNNQDNHKIVLGVSRVEDGVFFGPRFPRIPGFFTPNCTKPIWKDKVKRTGTGSFTFEYVSDAIGTTWQFLHPNISFQVGDRFFRSLAVGSWIHFKKNGVLVRGFEIYTKSPDGKREIVFAPKPNNPHEAAYYGYGNLMEKMLKPDGDVNIKDRSGMTPLMHAAIGGHPEVVDILMRKGANINAKSTDGWTALMLASQLDGSLPVVKKLLQGGADVNATSASGATALILACQGGNRDIVDELIQKKADVNKSSREGSTPLMSAAERGFTDIVQILIDNRADVNAADNTGWTALTGAVKQGHNDIVELLRKAGAK